MLLIRYGGGIASPFLEVQTGIEPVITVLQTVALPLGYWTIPEI